jgi:hypothetical protein
MPKRCSRCGASGVTVAVGLSATFVYLDLCELHLAELLRRARPIERPTSGPRRFVNHEPPHKDGPIEG